MLDPARAAAGVALLLCTATVPAQDFLVASRNSDQILQYDGVTGAFVGVFADTGGLDNPVGLSYGPDGHLYVVSADTNEVLKYDGVSGAFLGVFASGNGIDGPRNLNFGPDGQLYVANGGSSEVLRFDGVTGAFVDVFAGGNGLSGPTSLTFSPQGDLFVGSVLSDEVYRFDSATGAFLEVFVSTNVRGPHDLSFGPDGHLYVSNAFRGAITKFDGETGAFLGDFVSEPQLLNALGLTWGLDGMLYVANQGRDNIRRYDADGNFVDVFVTQGLGGLDGPLFAIFQPSASGPAIGPPAPGQVLQPNTVAVSGAVPGARLAFVYGWQPGTTPVNACPGLVVDVGNPRILGWLVADESGNALLRSGVPAALSGVPLRLQAVDAARCAAGPLATFTFP